MARIKAKDLFLKDDDQVYFGDNQEAALWYKDNELRLDHTISGTKATQGYHLVRKDQLPDEFLDLVDTPATYSGHAGKVVSVNSAENALEFSSTTASGTLYVLFTPGVLMQGDAGARPSMRIAGPVGTYAFDDSNEESCFSSFRTPDAYLANTDIVFEFGCFNNNTQAGVKSVRWAIDYHVYAPWDLFTSKTTSTYAVNIAFPNNATVGTLGYGKIVIPYNDVNNPLSANKGFMFRLYRDATSGSDTLAGDALLALSIVSLKVNT